MSNGWMSGWRIEPATDGVLIVTKHDASGKMICGCTTDCGGIANYVFHELAKDLLESGILNDEPLSSPPDAGEK